MDLKTERLSLFFEKIKTIGFWQRVFSWKPLRVLSYEAYEEFRKLVEANGRITIVLEDAKRKGELLENDRTHLSNHKIELEQQMMQLRQDIGERDVLINKLQLGEAAREERIEHLQKQLATRQQEMDRLSGELKNAIGESTRLRDDNTRYRETEEQRKKEFETNARTLNQIRDQILGDRKKEQDEKQHVQIQNLVAMKDGWARHEESVKSVMKRLCEKHIIEYVDAVPFAGNPDNTIRICGEYVIFDAKSPGSDDLNNFPLYIRAQAESVRKYVKEEGVKKNIYFVVPSNVSEAFDQFCHNMGDYTVFIVTLDALEPILLSLKKIEEYEFIEQLNPEERDAICRLIGKFAHVAKRRIQIDQFFEWQLLEVLSRCKADLPPEIFEKVIEYERSEKLNPPQEKRVKQILTQDLEQDGQKIQREATAKGIVIPRTLQREIGQLPLYLEDEPGKRDRE